MSQQSVQPKPATSSTAQPATQAAAPSEHVHWQWARLVLSILVCVLIIGAAVVFDKCG
ncbi:hypothetical protein JGU66_15955 [Myxococcaceae bacterium JPH2]|nr:hypothetical protein [Myxococcaceae bacterium JPH2]